MSTFGTIVIGSISYVPIGNGLYQRNTVVFGGPSDLIKIVGGRKTSKNAPTSALIARQVQKDVTVGSIVTRLKASSTLQLSVPDGFTTTEVDNYINDLSTFLTPTTLNQIFMGSS